MVEDKNRPENDDLTDSRSDIDRLKPEQADETTSSADEEDTLKGDTLAGDPEEDNNETLGIP